MLFVICYWLESCLLESCLPESPWSLVPFGLADGQPPTFPICELTRKINQSQEIKSRNWDNSDMRMLHTMLRVGNLEKSLDFYCNVLGMKLLRQKDYPGGEFTLAFVGYGDESDHTVIELTYNWGVEKYDLGNAYGHIALGVDDIYDTCEQIKAQGGKVTREPGPMKHGSTVIAFVEDPDGYKIELIQLGTQGTATTKSAVATV